MSRFKKAARVCAIVAVCLLVAVLAFKLCSGMILALLAFVGHGVASALGVFGVKASPSAALWLLFCAAFAASLVRGVVRK